MKILILISLVFSSSLWAVSGKEAWKNANLAEKVQILEGYREFFNQYQEGQLEAFDEKKVTLLNLVFDNAWAASTFNCIYAGWPSMRVGNVCSSPLKHNSDYQKGTCKSNEMQCQPLLFGNGLCTSVATKQQRNLAFSNCDKKFKASGKKPADVVREIEADGKLRSLHDLMDFADDICESGKQAGTAMCRRLENSLQSMRASSPTAPAAKVAPKSEEDEVKAEIASLPEPKVDAEQALVQTVQTVNEIPKAVAALNDYECPEGTHLMMRKVNEQDPKVPVIVCKPSETEISQEEKDAVLKSLNLGFHPSEKEITESPDYKNFLQEVKKFPRELLQEITDAGGKMKLIIGDGVATDPSWEEEKNQTIAVAQKAWDYYNKHGGTKPSVTVDEITRSYTVTIEGMRSWKYVAGSGGVNTDPSQIKPTRIVVNRLYKSLDNDGQTLRPSGTANLVLHEHAHALDNLYEQGVISKSQKWKDVMNLDKTKNYLKKIFSFYEGYQGEGFAELFAYYHGCEASRKQIETEAPELAEFFKNFKSVKDYNPTAYGNWKKLEP